MSSNASASAPTAGWANAVITPDTPNTTPVGIVSMQEDGIYLFGLLPILPVGLQSCLDRMVDEAKKSGAHGLADVAYEVHPAHMFKFNQLLIPDWSAMVRVTGTAYRNLPPIPTRPGVTATGRVDTAPRPAPAKK